jgi:hypothetical protein
MVQQQVQHVERYLVIELFNSGQVMQKILPRATVPDVLEFLFHAFYTHRPVYIFERGD